MANVDNVLHAALEQLEVTYLSSQVWVLCESPPIL